MAGKSVERFTQNAQMWEATDRHITLQKNG